MFKWGQSPTISLQNSLFSKHWSVSFTNVMHVKKIIAFSYHSIVKWCLIMSKFFWRISFLPFFKYIYKGNCLSYVHKVHCKKSSIPEGKEKEK